MKCFRLIRIVEAGRMSHSSGDRLDEGMSPISFNFNKMEVSLEKEGRRVVLQGNMETGSCRMIKGKKLHQLLRKKISQVAHLFSIEANEEWEGSEETEGNHSRIGQNQPHAVWQVSDLTSLELLLIEYQDLFVEPKSLPPPRSLDHAIPTPHSSS